MQPSFSRTPYRPLELASGDIGLTAPFGSLLGDVCCFGVYQFVVTGYQRTVGTDDLVRHFPESGVGELGSPFGVSDSSAMAGHSPGDIRLNETSRFPQCSQVSPQPPLLVHEMLGSTCHVSAFPAFYPPSAVASVALPPACASDHLLPHVMAHQLYSSS